MKKFKLSIVVLVTSALLANSFSALSAPNRYEQRHENRQEQRSEQRVDNRQDKRVDYRSDGKGVRYQAKPYRANKTIIVPRHRRHNNIVIVRPHGHLYLGYGHYHTDNDAWRWLAFTAITLKVLDNINEEAQRAHEAAQVKATSANVGEKITWQTSDSSGYVVATKEGKDSNGLTCREFQQEITVGGKTENAYGTACLQADGAWKIIES